MILTGCCALGPFAAVAGVGHYYRFKRGDPVTIVSGSYRGCIAVVDSAVFRRTVDRPDEYAPGYHVILDAAPVAGGQAGC